MITHYDLFAGIGGFSLALEEVFQDDSVRHVFCEWEKFPTSVLRQHWPDGEFWGDIAELVTHTENQRVEGQRRSGKGDTEHNGRNQHATDPQHTRLEGSKQDEAKGYTGLSDRERGDKTQEKPVRLGASANTKHNGELRAEKAGKHHQAEPEGATRTKLSVDEPSRESSLRRQGFQRNFTIVTGGFPCQPFSHAGRRKGTADDRYQWPNMFAVIRNTKPEWVIAENVRGLVTWNEGMVLETVCADLESEGYEVQPFIIPAVAVGAPHRRDRVWIIAHAECNGQPTAEKRRSHDASAQQQPAGQDNTKHTQRADSLRTNNGRSEATIAADTRPQRRSEGSSESIRPESQESERQNRQYPDWSRNWQEVAFATCDDTVDDGLSRLVDGVPMSRSKWRQNSLKAYGNGIVPEVAMNIMQAIKESMV